MFRFSFSLASSYVLEAVVVGAGAVVVAGGVVVLGVGATNVKKFLDLRSIS
jgi:hypothetical protein